LVATETELDLGKVDEIIDEVGAEKGLLISILQRTQEAYGYLPKPVLQRIADRLDVPFTKVYGVATFYSQFYLERRGRNVIRICDGTACHVRGATKLIDTAENVLGIKPGQTTPDYEYTFELVYCLGACALSPVVVINGNIVGRLTPEKLQALLDKSKAEGDGKAAE